MKKIITRYTPHPEKLKTHKYLSVFGEHFHSPNLWHINRRSISGAFAVGLFCTWMPVPFQMVLAAFGAIVFTVNLPVAVALVWISNPVTIPPLFYFAYWFGAVMLRHTPQVIEFELSFNWFTHKLDEIWLPLLLGCFSLAVISACAGYFIVRGLWRLHLVRRIKQRKKKYLKV